MTVPTWLPLLFLVACPLMMIYMMRGMGGGHAHAVGRGDEHAPGTTAENTGARDERLAELEHEVAELRASRDQPDTSQR